MSTSSLFAPSRNTGQLTWRRNPLPEDPAKIRQLVAATGFFSDEEADVAAELVEDRLTRGERSDYHFFFVEIDGTVVGYSCFGRIPFTRSSYDLYWVAVSPACQRLGIGRRLVSATEDEVRKAGGERLYVDTSTRAQYRPTRAFYEQLGYRLEARLADFYAPGDGKAIFCRVLTAPDPGSILHGPLEQARRQRSQ